MSYSANEVQTLATKAARGAGAPPAQAAAFGKAAYAHLAAGRSAQMLISALHALPAGPVIALPSALTRLFETAVEGKAKGPLTCAEAPDLARSYAETLAVETLPEAAAQGVQLEINLNQPAPRRPVQRITLDAALLDVLTGYLAKTLVPESEASRLAGAGAGLTDND